MPRVIDESATNPVEFALNKNLFVLVKKIKCKYSLPYVALCCYDFVSILVCADEISMAG